MYSSNTNLNALEFPGLERPTDGDSFIRIEDKFVAPRARLPQLLGALRAELPSATESGRRFTFVESCYFDSADLYTFRTHFSGEPSRFKLRTRRYSDHAWPVLGSADLIDEAYLELKIKENGVCRKHRFRVGTEDWQSLFEGEPLALSDELCSLNAKLRAGTLMKRVGAVNYKVGEFGLVPMSRVTYRREAYELDSLRVTVDHDVSYSMLNRISDISRRATCSNPDLWRRVQNMGTRYTPSNDVIVEVKHPGQIPNWLVEALSAGGFEQISFSKYVYSIYSELSEARRHELFH